MIDYTMAAEITRQYNDRLRMITDEYNARIRTAAPDAQATTADEFYVQYRVDKVSEGFEFRHRMENLGCEFYRKTIDGVKFVEVLKT